jgi:hypothetical protein
MRALLLTTLLLLPVPALAERLFKVTFDGQTYTARVVTDEPSGHLRVPAGEVDENGSFIEPEPIPLDAGPFEDAVRIGGTTEVDTAIKVLAAVCGFDYEEVKDWGAYGDPVWTDPRTGEIVFWTSCTR